MKVDITSLDGENAGSIDLDDAIFGLAPREDLIARMVRYQLAKRRAGTHQRDVVQGGEGGHLLRTVLATLRRAARFHAHRGQGRDGSRFPELARRREEEIRSERRRSRSHRRFLPLPPKNPRLADTATVTVKKCRIC